MAQAKETSMFSAEMLIGVPPEDAQVIVDFMKRLDGAMVALADRDEWPLEAFKEQEIIPGLVRLSDAVRDADEEFQVHPKFYLSGKAGHIKWFAILLAMYPDGGKVEETVVLGNVQGHPDFLAPDGLVIEVKTCAAGRWQYFKRRPLSIHVEQLKAYLFMTKRRVGLLVYENRDSLDVWAHVIRLGEDELLPEFFKTGLPR